MHNATKKLIELAVEGAKVIDLCIEGDKLIEQGTAAVYNKGGKGTKISKGAKYLLMLVLVLIFFHRFCFSNLHLCEQLCFTFFSASVSRGPFPIQALC